MTHHRNRGGGEVLCNRIELLKTDNLKKSSRRGFAQLCVSGICFHEEIFILINKGIISAKSRHNYNLGLFVMAYMVLFSNVMVIKLWGFFCLTSTSHSTSGLFRE